MGIYDINYVIEFSCHVSTVHSAWLVGGVYGFMTMLQLGHMLKLYTQLFVYHVGRKNNKQQHYYTFSQLSNNRH